MVKGVMAMPLDRLRWCRWTRRHEKARFYFP
jgi:hypothetical protein